MAAGDDQAKLDNLRAAIADYFEIDVEEAGAFCLAAESYDGSNSRIHTMWTGLPYWHFEGFAERIKSEIKNVSQRGQLEEALRTMSDE